MAAPKPADLHLLNSRASGVDAKGNLAYQGVRPVAKNLATTVSAKNVTSCDSVPATTTMSNGSRAIAFGLPGGGFATPRRVEGSNGAPVSYALVEEDVPLSEIPDYWPPIRPNAAKANLDSNVWILPTTSAQSRNGELVYDVVNKRREMTARVRIPRRKINSGIWKRWCGVSDVPGRQ